MDGVKVEHFLVYLRFVLWFLTIRQKNHLPDMKGLICPSHLCFKRTHSLERLRITTPSHLPEAGGNAFVSALQ